MAPSARVRVAPAASIAAGGVLAFLLLPAIMLSQVAAQPYTYTVETGIDYAFNDIRPSPGSRAPGCPGTEAYREDPKACEARCDAAAACAGFVHYADGNCCYIKTKMQNRNENPKTVTHFKTGYPGYTIEYNVDYPFNDITEGGTSPDCYNTGTQLESVEACLKRCDSVSACVGIAHYADNNCCYLKRVQETSNQNDRVASYKKTAPTPSPPSPPSPSSCSDLADKCDWYFADSGSRTPTFDLGNGKGDHALSPPIVYKDGQKVRTVDTNGGYTYTGRPIPHENQNQFYGNGAKVFYRTFNSPVHVSDYRGRCFSLRLTEIELEDGTNLHPGDGDDDYKEARRCVVFATEDKEDGFSAI